MKQERVVWITGASSGIGAGLAELAAVAGHTVGLTARRKSPLRELQQKIETRGGRAIVATADVANAESLAQAATLIRRQAGPITDVFANAGYAALGPVASLSAAVWRRQFDVNLFGAVNTVAVVLDDVIGARGRITMIGSVASVVPTPGAAAYCASKAALRAYSRCLAIELVGSGASCGIVFPGFVATEIANSDNLGQRVPGRASRQPPWLVWGRDRAVRQIWAAHEKRKLEHAFSWYGKLGIALAKHAPSTTHRLLSCGPLRRMSLAFDKSCG